MRCYEVTVPLTGLYTEIFPNISFILCNIIFIKSKTIGGIKCNLRIVKNNVGIIQSLLTQSSLYYKIMRENSMQFCKTHINNTFSLLIKTFDGIEKRKRERGRNNLHHFFHFFPTQALHSRFLSSELSVFIPICLRETVALVIVIILYIKSLVSRSALGNIIDSNYDENSN